MRGAVSPTHRPGTASARKGRMWPRRCGGGGWDHRRGRVETRTPAQRAGDTRPARRSPGWVRPFCCRGANGAAMKKAARWAAPQLDRRSRQIGIAGRQGAVSAASMVTTHPWGPRTDASSRRFTAEYVIIDVLSPRTGRWASRHAYRNTIGRVAPSGVSRPRSIGWHDTSVRSRPFLREYRVPSTEPVLLSSRRLRGGR